MRFFFGYLLLATAQAFLTFFWQHRHEQINGINTPVTSSCASDWLDDFSNDTMRKLLEPASVLEPHALVIYRNIAENSKGYGQWMRNMISMLRKAAIPLRFVPLRVHGGRERGARTTEHNESSLSAGRGRGVAPSVCRAARWADLRWSLRAQLEDIV